MPKFYITCGSFEFVTTAKDARSAALWAVHHFISNRVDLDTIDWTDPETIDRADLIDAMLELDEAVLLSEIGVGLDDLGQLDTADIMTEWNQLVIAISRIESLMI